MANDMKEAKSLIEKYKAGTCSPEEMRLIDKWLLEIHAGEPSELSAEDFEQIQNEVWLGVMAGREALPNPRVQLWPRVAVAAAAVAAITLSIWIYTSRRPEKAQDAVSAQYANDIAPGKNTATLTLANGKTISLSDQKTGVVIADDQFTYNDNTIISTEDSSSRTQGRDVSPAFEMTSVATPRGGTYQVILPDGTKVWLNAESKISFPSRFTGKERRVILTGEAYFSVLHNANQPFRVESNGQVVEDIGTEFNISAYADENSTKTTLVEGSARVFLSDRHPEFMSESRIRGATLQAKSKLALQGRDPDLRQDDEVAKQDANRSVSLNPNQQAINNGKIKVTTIDPTEFIAWKNGDFVFRNEPIQHVMKKLARWYNIEVSYDGVMPQDGLHGEISRNRNISQVLSLLEETGGVHFKVEGRRVTVSK